MKMDRKDDMFGLGENECFYCGQSIDPEFIKPDLDFPDAHRKCYDVWLIEQETIAEEKSIPVYGDRSDYE